MRKVNYILRHFDIELIKFSISSSAIEGISIEIIDIYEKNKSFFPIDLEITNTGIPKNRAFVQSFLAKLGLNINDTKGIIDICKGLSLNDCNWIVEDTFIGTFSKYNLYDNRFNRLLSLIAYTGYGESKQGKFASTPELTTGGMLAKCWRRISGDIILYKAGSTGASNTGNEPYSEFYAFQIAEAMGLNAIEYNLNKWKGQLFSTCKLFTSKDLSYIPTGRIITEGGWKAVMAYYKALGEEYYESLINMLIFDAVICNEDRHFGNFGLLIDNKKNKVIDTAPIFDNGLSLFNYAMEDDLQDVDAYSQTRLMATSQDFLSFAKEIITEKQKGKLLKLVNFKFKKHSTYNLPPQRLKIIEVFIQKRIQELLKL
jgi:hypothetical protein